MIHQIYLRTVKIPNLIKNGILSNFDFHGWPSKSDIFELRRLQIHEFAPFLQVTVQNSIIREFSTAVTEYIRLIESTMDIKVA